MEWVTNWWFWGATKKTYKKFPVISNDFVVNNGFFILQTVCVDCRRILIVISTTATTVLQNDQSRNGDFFSGFLKIYCGCTAYKIQRRCGVQNSAHLFPSSLSVIKIL